MTIWRSQRPDILTHMDLARAHRREVWRRRTTMAVLMAVGVAMGWWVWVTVAFSWATAAVILVAVGIGAAAGYGRRHRRTRSQAALLDPKVFEQCGPLATMAAAVARQMGVALPVVLRFVRGQTIAAQTVARRGGANPHVEIRLHEGLVRILNAKEIRAVVAHEIGHHLAPKGGSRWLSEHWADYYAGKHGDPVALANALLKIDHNLYLLQIFVQRALALGHASVRSHLRGPAMNAYALNAVRLPLQSKQDARRQARDVIHRYINGCGPGAANPTWLKRGHRFYQSLVRRAEPHRQRLARQMVVAWVHFDQRIANEYLDQYELMALDMAIGKPKATVGRFHFFDRTDDSHPNVNRRLRFIVHHFLKTSRATP